MEAFERVARAAVADASALLRSTWREAKTIHPKGAGDIVAEHGRGARLNDQPISVSTTDALDAALLATGFPYDRREHVDFYLGFLRDFVARAQGVRRNGSAALDLCYVACGRLDAFWEWKLHPWDTAAGAVIVREAQGTVSDFRGATFDLFGEQTLASNGALHPEMLRALASGSTGA